MLDPQSDLLTVNEAAALADISAEEMRALFDRYAFPITHATPTTRLVRRDDLLAYLEAPRGKGNADELLTVSEVAAELRILPRTARRLFDQRAFPLVRIGRRLYVRRRELEAYLEANTISAGWQS